MEEELSLKKLIPFLVIIVIAFALPAMAGERCVFDDNGSYFQPLPPPVLDQILENAAAITDQNTGVNDYLEAMKQITLNHSAATVLRSSEVLHFGMTVENFGKRIRAKMIDSRKKFERAGLEVVHGYLIRSEDRTI